jgi:3-hydroxyisobutyrate dehydrogenase-like beta-hydroxyacid dehydrogenase
MQIGLIGLGRMGANMARRLARHAVSNQKKS